MTPNNKITVATMGTFVNGVKPIMKKTKARIANAKPRTMREIATGNLENLMINP